MAIFNDTDSNNTITFGEDGYTFGDIRLDFGGGEYSGFEDGSGTGANFTDLSGSLFAAQDRNSTHLSNSNVNVFSGNELPLNDVYPWMNFNNPGFIDLTGSADNFTDL